MNTYTFTYYGFIPGYNDFDQEFVDVKANTVHEANEIISTYRLLVVRGIYLYAINGIPINKKQD